MPNRNDEGGYQQRQHKPSTAVAPKTSQAPRPKPPKPAATAATSKPGEPALAVPGKTSTSPDQSSGTPRFLTGDKYVDDGAVCDGHAPGANGCLFDDAQRARHIDKLTKDSINAQTNYKLAIAALQVAELMKKEEDLHWVSALLLDVVTGHLAGMAVKVLTRARNVAANALNDAAERAVTGGGTVPAGTIVSAAEAAIGAVSPARIGTITKGALGPGKSTAVGVAKQVANQPRRQEQAEAVAYLDLLQNSCDLAYDSMLSRILAEANDAELLVFADAMRVEYNTVALFKAELEPKLARFRASGVTSIGRKQVNLGHDDVYRDTRVVWVTHDTGMKTLWYEVWDGDMNPNVIHKNDPGHPEFSPGLYFGPSHPRGEPKLDRRVPAEFVDVAVLRSTQMWGWIPVMNDPATTLLRDLGYKSGNGRSDA